MNYGFFRVAAATPELAVADIDFNTEHIITEINRAALKNVRLIIFPELCITGYTCSDLFFQTSLQEKSIEALEKIARETSSIDIISAVGLPIKKDGALYNTAAIIHKGKILAVIPKSFIPNYAEFYERRHFSPARNIIEKNASIFISRKNPEVPFGTDILFTDEADPDFTIAFEICEDLWVPEPPSVRHSLNGATIIANLSASNEIVGKAEYRRLLVKSQSARCVSAYIYANAGHGESTQDLIFSGHSLIAENGNLLSESRLFSNEMVIADIDVEKLIQERNKMSTFAQNASTQNGSVSTTENKYRKIHFKSGITDYDKEADFYRTIAPHPFVPSSKERRSERCMAVIRLQAEGLAKRLRHINAKTAVLGLSGGLDSTLALLVTVHAFDLCKIDRHGIIAITMPCFGTTDRTYNNAIKLAESTGTTIMEIPISDSVRQHFKDIGQDENIHDVTYENSQARERTQILMDIANKNNGIVIGTGDLSELALGWATYNGDHMSMYGVNASIPKTLVRHLVEWEADSAENQHSRDVLKDILDTPVSPELLPPEDGKISQKTEEIVGPYELHDFFLYYLLRFGFSPSKIYFMAGKAFGDGKYTKPFIKKWLKIFYRRFFTQQFKRSCLPDGAKVGTVNLSPRGDWRMPSDASYNLWIKEIEGIPD